MKVSLRGDSAIALCDATTPVRAFWTEKDVILFTESAGHTLTSVDAQGGRSAPIARQLPSRFAPARYTMFSEVLPGGRWALLTVWRGSMSGDYATIHALDLETGRTRSLVRLGYDCRYAHTGHLVFVRGSALHAVPFDAETLKTHGEPVAVVSGVTSDSLFAQGQFALSPSGALAYVPGGDRSVGILAWVDREGGVEPLPVEPQIFGVASISPNGRRLAVEVADLEDYVRLYELASADGGRRLAAGGQPVWSRDSLGLTYSFIDSSDRWAVARQPTDRSRAPEVLLTSTGWLVPASWSREGEVLALTEFGVGSAEFGVGLLYANDDNRYETEEEGEPVVPVFSPDGSFLAYQSTTSGRYEIWVRSLDGDVRRQISTDGGWEPVWRENGELFWRSGYRIWSTRVTTRSELSWDPPRVAFETDYVDTQGRSFDVSPDGQRLLVVKEATEPEVAKIRWVENWFADLERMAPVN